MRLTDQRPTRQVATDTISNPPGEAVKNCLILFLFFLFLVVVFGSGGGDGGVCRCVWMDVYYIAICYYDNNGSDDCALIDGS